MRPVEIHDCELVSPSAARPEPTPGTAEDTALIGSLRSIASELQYVNWSGGSNGAQTIEDAADELTSLRARLASLTESSRRSEEDRALAEARLAEVVALADALVASTAGPSYPYMVSSVGGRELRELREWLAARPSSGTTPESQP